MSFQKSIDSIELAWSKQEHERLGQFFINRYIKSITWPELFYSENHEAAKSMIIQWLTDHQYLDTMPPQVHNIGEYYLGCQ